MTSIVDALYDLQYNPFKYGSYLASFYSSLGTVENNILLAPLVIPLCSHPFFSMKLEGANANSSIWTIFDGETRISNDRDRKKYEKFLSSPLKNKIIHREQLYDLQERINEFQKLTEKSIQYCLINDWLSIDTEKIALHASVESNSNLSNQKGAGRLGHLLHCHSVIEIYAFLGVKPQ